MSTTIATIIDHVQANLPTGYHSDDLTDAVLARYINNIQEQLCRAHNFAFMKQEVTRSTSDETQTYSLPTAGDSDWTRVAGGGSSTVLRFKRDISLELINSQSYRVPLIKLHKQLLEDKKILAKETGTGIPQYYDVDQNLIWLYKKPKHSYNADSAWTMNFEFYGYLTDVSDDGSDHNEVTDNHDLLLEYGATSSCFVYGKNWTEADKWKQMASDIFLQMLDEDTDLQLSGIEEGMFPADAQSIGGGSPYKGFLQGVDWYVG